MGCKREKRGQVSYFVIVGIFVLFIFGFLYYISNLKYALAATPNDMEKMVNDAFSRASNNALVYISKQGGIYLVDDIADEDMVMYNESILASFKPPNINDIKGMNLDEEPIIYQKIEIEQFEKDISFKTKELLEVYLKENPELSLYDIDSAMDQIDINTQIEEDRVVISMDSDFVFESSSFNRAFSSLEIPYMVRLYDMVYIANSFIGNENNYLVNFKDMNPEYKHINVDMYRIDDDDVLFITGNKVDGKVFRFALAIDK